MILLSLLVTMIQPSFAKSPAPATCTPKILRIAHDPENSPRAHFFVADENNNIETQNFTWSSPRMRARVGPDITLSNAGLMPCSTELIRAKYTECSVPKEITYTYTIPGAACTATCPNTITLASGTVLRRLTRSTIADRVYGGAWPVWNNVNTTEFADIWSYTSGRPYAPPYSWPALSGSRPIIGQFTRNNFVAAHFRTPANLGTPAQSLGYMAGSVNIPPDYVQTLPPGTYAFPNLDVSISTMCGNFDPQTTNPLCSIKNVSSGGLTNVIRWSATNNCVLQPNTDYYFNIKISDPDHETACPNPNLTCPVALAHYGN